MGGQSFWANLWGDVLHGNWWSDHARRKLMIRVFKVWVKLVFLSLSLTWVIDILFEKLTPHIGE